MKNSFYIYLLFFVSLSIAYSSPAVSIEGEVGMYKPNDSDFDGQQSVRVGGTVGLDVNIFELYGGYKIWKNIYSDVDWEGDGYKAYTWINTGLLGVRKNILIYNGLGLRLGTAILFSDTVYQHRYDDSEWSYFNYNIPSMKSLGFSIQGGITYVIENLTFCIGINYLLFNAVVDKIEFPSDGTTYTASELGLSADDREYTGNGANIKFSIAYSLEILEIFDIVEKLINNISSRYLMLRI